MKHASLRRSLALLLTLCLVMTVTAFTALAESAAPNAPGFLGKSETLALNTIKSGKIDKDSATFTAEDEENYPYLNFTEGTSYQVIKLAVKANVGYLISFLTSDNLSDVVMMSDVDKALETYYVAYEGIGLASGTKVGTDQIMTPFTVTSTKDCNLYFVLSAELADDTDVCKIEAKAIDLTAKRVYDQEITISSKADLLALANRKPTLNDDHLKVIFQNDIDLTGTTWPGVSCFSGWMEGNGHKVTGLTTKAIENPMEEEVNAQAVGLATVAAGATFRNLSVEAVYPDGFMSADGAFCFTASNSTFENCTGTVKATSSVIAMGGGLCGIAEYCVFQDCTGSLNLTFQAKKDEDMSAVIDVGGMVGSMNSCKAYDSKGTLTCKTDSMTTMGIGGFVGSVNASLTDGCNGTIDFSGISASSIGGFAGGKSSDMLMSLSLDGQTEVLNGSSNQFRNCSAQGKIDTQLSIFTLGTGENTRETAGMCESLGGFIGSTERDSFLNCNAITDVFARDFSAQTKASVIDKAKKADADFVQGDMTDEEFFQAAMESLEIYSAYYGGGTDIGGFAGKATAPVMDNCYAGGDVTGGSWDVEMDAGLFFGSLHTGEFPVVLPGGEETTETTDQTKEELLAGIKNIYWNTNAKLIWSGKTMKPASCSWLYEKDRITFDSMEQEKLPEDYVEYFKDGAVDFSDTAAVAKMTAALNKRAGELTNCNTWSGSNAKNAPMIRCFTVTFQNEKGQTIGTVAAFAGENITSRAVAIPAKKGYTGKWNASLSNVNSNMTVGVTYTKNGSNNTDKPGNTDKPNNQNPGTGSAGAMGAGVVLLLAGAVLVVCKKRSK